MDRKPFKCPNHRKSFSWSGLTQVSLVPLIINYSLLSSFPPLPLTGSLTAGFQYILGHQQSPLQALNPLPLFDS